MGVGAGLGKTHYLQKNLDRSEGGEWGAEEHSVLSTQMPLTRPLPAELTG